MLMLLTPDEKQYECWSKEFYMSEGDLDEINDIFYNIPQLQLDLKNLYKKLKSRVGEPSMEGHFDRTETKRIFQEMALKYIDELFDFNKEKFMESLA